MASRSRSTSWRLLPRSNFAVVSNPGELVQLVISMPRVRRLLLSSGEVSLKTKTVEMRSTRLAEHWGALYLPLLSPGIKGAVGTARTSR